MINNQIIVQLALLYSSHLGAVQKANARVLCEIFRFYYVITICNLEQQPNGIDLIQCDVVACISVSEMISGKTNDD